MTVTSFFNPIDQNYIGDFYRERVLKINVSTIEDEKFIIFRDYETIPPRHCFVIFFYIIFV